MLSGLYHNLSSSIEYVTLCYINMIAQEKSEHLYLILKLVNKSNAMRLSNMLNLELRSDENRKLLTKKCQN